MTTEIKDYNDIESLKAKLEEVKKGSNKIILVYNGYEVDTGIKVDNKYYRPLEIDYLKGNPKKAFKELNYKLKHDLKDLVKDMLDSDIRNLNN